MVEKDRKDQEQKPLEPGTGAQCPEAQADGVPCDELGHDCEECGNAVPRSVRESSWNHPKSA
jgi:hypothetical protein